MTQKPDSDTLRIVKIGGRIIDDTERLHIFLSDFSDLAGHKILVHGGGRTADTLMEKMGIKPSYYKGRRITDAETMKIVTMAYAGWINKSITARLQKYGCNAIGLSGADANLIRAVKRPAGEIDFGFAGDVVETDAPVLIHFLGGGLVPVLCAITHDKQGNLLNTNADTIASEVAITLSEAFSVELLYCFEKPGVLRDPDDPASYLREIDNEYYRKGMEDKTLTDGILPKLHNAFHALEKGVHSVLITSFDAISQDSPEGTRIVL